MINLNLIKKHNLSPPLFLYDSNVIKKQFLKLKKNLPKNSNIFYSVKSNPNICILKIFKKLGAGVEISSGKELLFVLKAGFSPSRIIFTSPGKTDEGLEDAIKKKIYLIIVESINEVKKIEEIAQKLKTKQSLLLRVNPLIPLESSSMLFVMAGDKQKFGIDEEQLPQVIKSIRNFKNIKLLGLHLFSISNVSDERLVIRNTEHLFKIVQSLESKFNFHLPIIDIGGGISINYSTRPDKTVNLEKISNKLETLINKYEFNDKNIIWESGRFLIGEAGEYVAQVIDKKISRGEVFIIINGGKHHFSGATGLLKEDHPVEVLNKKKSRKKEVVSIVGNLNTSYDFITRTNLPKIEIGDLICIKNVGAYGFSAGMVFFSGHTLPGEYLLSEKKELKSIRKKFIKYQ